MTRLGVVGSRTFRDFPLLCRTVPLYRPSLIISGGAIGADTFGEWYAELMGIDALIFPPDFSKPGAYHRRDRQIAEECDRLLAFWNGKSPGTRYTINYAKFIGKPVDVVRFK